MKKIRESLRQLSKRAHPASAELTKLDAVRMLRPSIVALRKKRYGLAEIATALSKDGLAISPGTLASYLDRCAREQQAEPSKDRLHGKEQQAKAKLERSGPRARTQKKKNRAPMQDCTKGAVSTNVRVRGAAAAARQGLEWGAGRLAFHERRSEVERLVAAGWPVSRVFRELGPSLGGMGYGTLCLYVRKLQLPPQAKQQVASSGEAAARRPVPPTNASAKGGAADGETLVIARPPDFRFDSQEDAELHARLVGPPTPRPS